MTTREDRAAVKTRNRECFMAIKAAMRKVLSPTSEKRIMMNERRKECIGAEIVESSAVGFWEERCDGVLIGGSF